MIALFALALGQLRDCQLDSATQLSLIHIYIGLLTALRVSHDSSDRNLSSSVVTYPLNQSQICIFTEEVLKLVREKGQVTAWDLYYAATDI